MSNSLLWIIDDTGMHLSDRLDSEPYVGDDGC